MFQWTTDGGVTLIPDLGIMDWLGFQDNEVVLDEEQGRNSIQNVMTLQMIRIVDLHIWLGSENYAS